MKGQDERRGGRPFLCVDVEVPSCLWVDFPVGSSQRGLEDKTGYFWLSCGDWSPWVSSLSLMQKVLEQVKGNHSILAEPLQTQVSAQLGGWAGKTASWRSPEAFWTKVLIWAFMSSATPFHTS